MHLHLVGGFLGSGKTTAIIGAVKQLLAAGRRAAVVTNDQGKYLVDTAFVKLTHAPTVEVTGGCFCCNYDDLQKRLEQLEATARPEVIFAESVGSCADLVATVVKPLLALRSGGAAPASFSVFADARLLQRRLAGLPLPFSDHVVYIFDKQLEEAGLLVVNKADQLPSDTDTDLVARLRARFPGKPYRLQNSLTSDSVGEWLALLEAGAAPVPQTSLDIDYGIYGDGERRLAWLDAELALQVRPGQGRDTVRDFIGALVAELARQQAPLGHLKFMVAWPGGEVKISLTAGGQEDWRPLVPEIAAAELTVLVNARVELGHEALRAALATALAHVRALPAVTCTERSLSVFHPGLPRPTHRLA